MKALAVLPISTKNMLEESRVLQFIQRWAQSRPQVLPSEQDGYSSESTSRAQTPLNTPDGSSSCAKLGQELDAGDTPKRAVYRRLKIVSENSLDSAMSDASKASDCKEEDDEDEEEEDEEEEVSQQAEAGEVGPPLANESGPEVADSTSVKRSAEGEEDRMGDVKVEEEEQPQQQEPSEGTRKEEGEEKEELMETEAADSPDAGLMDVATQLDALPPAADVHAEKVEEPSGETSTIQPEVHHIISLLCFFFAFVFL